MQPNREELGGDWGDSASQTFIDYGRYFVPEREAQIKMFCDLIPAHDGPFEVIELCCGEGLLAAGLLERFPQCTVLGLDGSPTMLERAGNNLAAYGERFKGRLFDLAATDWRAPAGPVHGIVSSLAIHHLDGEQKQALFRDSYAMLAPGGVLLIADVVQPADERGSAVAADAWDDAVRERSLTLDGNTDGFEFFLRREWNMYRNFDPADIDKPSRLFEQLKWLEQAEFAAVDVYWMRAGHALFGGRKA